ncbi:MAG: hypothetical protein EXR00_03505 [Alphaproteobacteria bacterium]|nr:hypothetical protein [Alphaproteobacteria bacterium]
MNENPVSRRLILSAALSLMPAAAYAQNSTQDLIGGVLNQLTAPRGQRPHRARPPASVWGRTKSASG